VSTGYLRVLVSTGYLRVLVSTGYLRVLVSTGYLRVLVSTERGTAARSVAHGRFQAIAELARMFTTVPLSAIADALSKTGFNVQQAAGLLAKPTQESRARTVSTHSEYTPFDCSPPVR